MKNNNKLDKKVCKKSSEEAGKKCTRKRKDLFEKVCKKSNKELGKKYAGKVARIQAGKDARKVSKTRQKGMQRSSNKLGKKYARRQPGTKPECIQNNEEPRKRVSCSWEIGKKGSDKVARNQESKHSMGLGKK